MKKSVSVNAISSIVFAALAAVGWIMFLGAFGYSNSPPSGALASIPLYFTAVTYPVLAILLIGAAIQVLVAPQYRIIQALLMPAIIILTVTNAAHAGTIMNAFSLVPASLNDQVIPAVTFWGVLLEMISLTLSVFFLIDANIYLRD